MKRVDVFISYSSKEHDRVNMIRMVLEKNGIICWMAPQDIPFGSSYANEIPVAIKKCTVFLLMISRKSQQSQWVPKEASIALSLKKIVIPFVMENCELTESFNFFLTDVQRYNAYEQQSESMSLLIDRIKNECHTNKADTNNKEDGHITLLDDGHKNNLILIEWISKYTKAEINRTFSEFLTKLKKKYKENPNAETIKAWMQTEMLDGFSICSILDEFFIMGLYSYSAVEIFIQIAVIYIHSGARTYVREARNFLEKAIRALTETEEYDEVIFKRVVYAKWLLAVTYKQDRNYGHAYDLCEDLITFIHDENKVFDVPFADALLLPQREIIVINKEKVMCDYLVAKTPELGYNMEQLFYTQRRLFEFYVLDNDFAKAKELLPELLNTFSKCQNQLDAIYQVGLYQNLFEYYTYIGEKDLAQEYYDSAMEKAKQNFWKRKQEKLATLKEIYT